MLTFPTGQWKGTHSSFHNYHIGNRHLVSNNRFKILLSKESLKDIVEVSSTAILVGKESLKLDRHMNNIFQLHLLEQNKYFQSFYKRIRFFTGCLGAQMVRKVQFSMSFN
jgi:hypothetical protein